MKPNFQNCIYGVLLLLFMCAVNAQGVDEKKLLEEVINMKDEQRPQNNQDLQRALTECHQASFSNQKAVNFYVKTIKDMDFSGGTGKNFTSWQEWQKRNDRLVKNNTYQAAIRLHLIYLCICIKKAAGIPVSDLLNDLVAYTDSVAMSHADTKKQPFLRQHVQNGVFAKRYFLADALKFNPREWETVPGNIEAMWTKTILPELVKNKDARAIQYLDKRLKQESDMAAASKDAMKINNFNQVQRPEMLWQRAEMLLLLGKREQALVEMRNVVQNWPNHPKRETWLNALQSAITNPEEGTIFR